MLDLDILRFSNSRRNVKGYELSRFLNAELLLKLIIELCDVAEAKGDEIYMEPTGFGFWNSGIVQLLEIKIIRHTVCVGHKVRLVLRMRHLRRCA